jgi:hypothetical protein
MMNITTGIHLKSSKLKQLKDIHVLPSGFFELVSEMNSAFEPLDVPEFVAWYRNNFTLLNEKRESLIEVLLKIFLGDARVLDIWSEY